MVLYVYLLCCNQKIYTYLEPVSQNYLVSNICLKIKICLKIYLRSSTKRSYLKIITKTLIQTKCKIAAESILLQNKHSNRRHVSSGREIMHWTIQRIWISLTKFFNLCAQLKFLQSMRTTKIFYALPISLQVMTGLPISCQQTFPKALHQIFTTRVLLLFRELFLWLPLYLLNRV